MLVSVIIPYYLDEKYIEFSVQSVLNQSYKNFEIIIVDNENSEKSKKILKNVSQKSKKIKIIKNKKMNSAGIARNIGINNCRGEFIAFIDSDDLWKKKKIEHQIRELKKKKLDLIFTNFFAINEKFKLLYKVRSPTKITYEDLIKSCPFACSSALIKKECFKKIKFSSYKTKEDYELWLNFSKNFYKIGSLNKYYTIYRVRKNSLSSKYMNKLINAYKIYRNNLNFNIFYSLYCVIRLYFNAFDKKFLN